jgi:tripartite-type tricarboxylate transporter receptor subunit TctC
MTHQKAEARLIRTVVALLLALTAAANAQESWPSRSITIVVPYSAGTAPDVIARQ